MKELTGSHTGEGKQIHLQNGDIRRKNWWHRKEGKDKSKICRDEQRTTK